MISMLALVLPEADQIWQPIWVIRSERPNVTGVHTHDPKPAFATRLIKACYLWNTLSHYCKVIKILLPVLYWIITQPGRPPPNLQGTMVLFFFLFFVFVATLMTHWSLCPLDSTELFHSFIFKGQRKKNTQNKKYVTQEVRRDRKKNEMNQRNSMNCSINNFVFLNMANICRNSLSKTKQN